MNIIKKKCMLITPCNVTFRTSSGKEIKPNTKSIEFVLTKEILVAMNSGIRVFEIGSDGKQVQLNKSNFDKINVLMNYDETAEEKEAPTEPVGPVKITPSWLKGETDEPKEEETVDPAEEESPSEEGDEPEDEEVDMTPQEDPEAKYYDTDSDSKDDCDEEKENDEDDEFNVD